MRRRLAQEISQNLTHNFTKTIADVSAIANASAAANMSAAANGSATANASAATWKLQELTSEMSSIVAAVAGHDNTPRFVGLVVIGFLVTVLAGALYAWIRKDNLKREAAKTKEQEQNKKLDADIAAARAKVDALKPAIGGVVSHAQSDLDLGSQSAISMPLAGSQTASPQHGQQQWVQPQQWSQTQQPHEQEEWNQQQQEQWVQQQQQWGTQ